MLSSCGGGRDGTRTPSGTDSGSALPGGCSWTSRRRVLSPALVHPLGHLVTWSLGRVPRLPCMFVHCLCLHHVGCPHHHDSPACPATNCEAATECNPWHLIWHRPQWVWGHGVAAVVAAAQTQQPRGVCAAGLWKVLVLTAPAILCGTSRKGGALLVTLYWSLVPLGANRWAHHSSMAHWEHALCSWAADTWVSIQITGQCAHNVWLCVHVWHHGCVVALQGGPVVRCRLPELSGCGVSLQSCSRALLCWGCVSVLYPGTAAIHGVASSQLSWDTCLPACLCDVVDRSLGSSPWYYTHQRLWAMVVVPVWLDALYMCRGTFCAWPLEAAMALVSWQRSLPSCTGEAVPVCVGPSTECGAPASVAGRTGARCGCIISLLGATAVQYACARVVDECNTWHAALPTDCLHASVLHTCVHGTYNTQPWYICPLCRLPPSSSTSGTDATLGCPSGDVSHHHTVPVVNGPMLSYPMQTTVL
jgi:hypothetical protein